MPLTSQDPGWTRSLNRRRFLSATAGCLAAPTIVSAAALARGTTAPSERLQIGIVGLGSRGFNLLDQLLARADVRIVAICDVDTFHYRDRPWDRGQAYGCEPAREKIRRYHTQAVKGETVTEPEVYRDYRLLCQRDDVDAVVIATPDHWHALCTLEALQRGKDVYCEKPVTHRFAEGQRIYREVAQRKAVFQTGSQQRSDDRFRHAVELIRNGVLGTLERIEVGLPPGYDKPQGDVMVVEPPEHLDYDFWCGPSSRLPYMQARHHRWWRGHSAYGGGVLMDWIGHHNDIAHWSLDLDQSGPTRVEAVGWTFPDTPVYDTPHHYEIRCEYSNGVTSSISNRHTMGTKWIGSDGWLHVTRGKLQASDPRWTRLDFESGPIRVYRSADHMANFIDCIRSRKPCIAPAETAHRSITPGHLAYVSQALGRPMRWDPKREVVLDLPEADGLLRQLDYRSPWQLVR